MIKLFVNDIPKVFNINNTQLNMIAIKALLIALENEGMAHKDKQKIIFDENIFIKLWDIYETSLVFFDPNYNRKNDFKLYFINIIRSLHKKEKLNFFALFCPGYTTNGYKKQIGATNKWKLEELKNILNYFKNNNIDTEITSYYSDVFLENTNAEKNPKWKDEMLFNREIFHKEAEKHFESKYIKNASQLPIFSDEKNIKGYVNMDTIKKLNQRTYYAFKKANEKFYNQLGFTEEQIIFRNDRLITMYKILSNYINSQKNTIFLPMENMYEREKIFSENNTCTLYLKLKK